MRDGDPTPKQPIIPFEPVAVRSRHDGWTVEKQFAFIEALAETGVVEEACRRVGMSRTSADKLRRRSDGVHFRRAWEAAIDYSLYRLEEDAVARSRNGVARPIFHKGEQVGEYRHYDERLTMFLLKTRRPQRYGKWIERMGDPEDAEPEEESGITLDGRLAAIEFLGEDIPANEEPNEDGSVRP